MANTSHNESLAPVGADQRVFGWYSHASLWFSLGVGLLVIQLGAYLVPAVGTQDALLAIVLGSVLGAGLLGWVAKIACDTGLSSAGLMHQVYGSSFARLPVLLNILQLVGWTTFELVVMRDGTLAMFGDSWWGAALTATLLWGTVLTLLTTGSMLGLVRSFVSRFGLPLVVLSLLWLSYQFVGLLQAQGWAAFWNRPGTGEVTRRFLADKRVVLQVWSTVFVHGGLLPSHLVGGSEGEGEGEGSGSGSGSGGGGSSASRHGGSGGRGGSTTREEAARASLDRINALSASWMRGEGAQSGGGVSGAERGMPAFLRGRDAVVWSRSFSAEDPRKAECALLREALSGLPGAKRMVMGHTIQEAGVNGACEGAALRVDVG